MRPAFSDDDLQVMASALAQRGALQSMLHWYRAAFRHPPSRPNQVIQAPTLLIWAEDDVALGKSLAQGLEKRVPNMTVHTIPNCGHWVQNEASSEVNRAMLEFLGMNPDDIEIMASTQAYVGKPAVEPGSVQAAE